MRDHEPQGHPMLMVAGVLLYEIAVLLQMFSFWANAHVWGWMTLKYLALGGVGIAPLLLPAGRARMARVLAGLFAVLALAGQLSYSEGSIEAHAAAKRHRIERNIAEAERGWQAADTREARNFRYYDGLLAGLQGDMAAARANMDAAAWQAREAELKKSRDEAEKKYQQELKRHQTYGAAQRLFELRHELATEHPAWRVDERRAALRSAKVLDFFILLGLALLVAGCLLPGDAAVPPYTVPGAAVKEP
jgi:hypothetical protein